MKVRLLGYYIVFFLLLLITGCGSNSGGKNLFTDHGAQPGDVVAIEISAPGLSAWQSGEGSATNIPAGNTSDAVNSDPVTDGKRVLTLDVGTSAQFSVGATASNGEKHEDLSVTWTSGNAAIAAVDKNGKVISISPGITTVIAEYALPDGTVVTDKVAITVIPSPSAILSKAWVKSDATLKNAVWDHASAIWNGYIYVAGGNSECTGNLDYKDCGFSNKVFYSAISLDGSTGSFIQTTSMPLYLRGHSLVADNGYIYIIGGIMQFPPPCIPDDNTCTINPPDPNLYIHGPSNTVLNEKVYYAKINPDGTIGGWIETLPLPPSPELLAQPDKAGLFAHSAVVVNGYIYVIGGWNVELEKNVNTVLVGVLDPAGGIKEWLSQPQFNLPYTDGLSKHASVAVNVNGDNYLYVIGGNSGNLGTQEFHNEIYYTLLAIDGVPEGWKLSTNNLPRYLIDHAAVSSGRYIFVLGGRDGVEVCSGPTPGIEQVCTHPYNNFQDVYYYFVNDSGDLDSVNSAPSMPVPLFHHAAVTDNTSGNIYITGGASGNTEISGNRHNEVYYLTK